MPDERNDAAALRPEMNAFQRLAAIFVSPKKVFSDVAAGAPWWEPWAWGSLLYMVAGYLSLPVQVRIYELTRGGISSEEFQRGLEWAASPAAKALAVGTWPVWFLVAGGLFTALSYVAVSALSERSSFKKHFAICLWGAVVAAPAGLLSVVVVRLRGIEEIRGVRDAIVPFGPAVLLPADAGRISFALLTSIDLFYVWFYVLVAVGVVQVFGMSRRGSLLVVIPLWLITVLTSLIRPS